MSQDPALFATDDIYPQPAGLLSARLQTPDLRRWQILAGVAVLLLYFAALSSTWAIGKDSALYLLLAKSLAEGHGLTLFGDHLPFVQRPGFPAMLAALIEAGWGNMFCLNLAMLLMGLLALWFAYQILRELTGPGWALVAAMLVAVSRSMHSQSLSQLTDVPVMLVILGALWCYLQGLKRNGCWLEIGSVLLIASSWIKVTGLPVACGAAIGLLMQPGQPGPTRRMLNAVLVGAGLLVSTAALVALENSWTRTAAVTASAATGSGASTIASPRPTIDDFCQCLRIRKLPAGSNRLQRALHNCLDGGTELVRLFAAQSLPQPVAVFFWLPILFGMWMSFKNRHYVCLFTAVFYLAATLPFSNLVLARFLLVLSPLWTLYFLQGYAYFLERCLKPRYARYGLLCLCGLLMLFNLPRDLLLICELHNPAVRGERSDLPPLQEASEFVRQVSRPGDTLFGADAIMLAYLSNIPCSHFAFNPVADEAYSREAVLQTVLKSGANFIVIETDPHKHLIPYFAVLRQIVEQNPQFEQIFRNGRYQLYRPRETLAGAPPAPAADQTPLAAGKQTSGSSQQ